jgi:hypothetical protein
MFPKEACIRIGSNDVTFSVPGLGEQLFDLVPNKAAVEFQCLYDQAFFLEKPAHGVYGSGITYS